MPPDPVYTFDSAYHQQRRWTAPHSLRCLEVAMTLLGTPTSLLDVGCAEGVHVQWARQRGIDAMGIDLAVPDGDPSLVRADLRERIDLHRLFQWVICWEVAEHLPEMSADRLCHTIVRHMAPNGRILFTAAHPGQRGPGHINTQPEEYWMEKFLDLGVNYADTATEILRRAWLRAAPRTKWYGENCHVYWRVA